MATIIDESDRPLSDDTVKGTEMEKGEIQKLYPSLRTPTLQADPGPTDAN